MTEFDEYEGDRVRQHFNELEAIDGCKESYATRICKLMYEYEGRLIDHDGHDCGFDDDEDYLEDLNDGLDDEDEDDDEV